MILYILNVKGFWGFGVPLCEQCCSPGGQGRSMGMMMKYVLMRKLSAQSQVLSFLLQHRSILCL